MSTLRISNIEAKSVPASATIDEKVKITNSSGDTLVFIDGKTSGITTVGINTTDSNITFDANSNVVVTGIITATRFSGQITPTSLEIGSNIKLGNAGVITATSFVGGLPITGGADNRVITASSASAIQGESNLTFDGNNLAMSGTGVFTLTRNSRTLTLEGNYGNEGHPAIKTSSGHDLRIFTSGNNERFRITSAGKVGINYSSPVSIIHALGNSTVGTSVTMTLQSHDTANATSGINLLARRNDNVNETCKIQAASGGQNSVDLQFHTNSNERLRITSTGELGVNTTAPVEKLGISGNMRFVNPNGTTSRITALPSGTYSTGTSGGSAVCFQRVADGGGGSDEIFFETHWQGNRHGESCRINKYGNLAFPNGQGIDFSNKTVAGDQGTSSSRILDDYEEGDWTCTLSGTGGGSIQASRAGYTKIGNLVVCEASFINPGNNSVSGNWSMTLPFQFIGAGSGSYGGGQVTYTRYVPALTGGFQSYTIFTYYGQGSAYLYKLATNGSSEAQWTGGSVNNSLLFSFTMSYITST